MSRADENLPPRVACFATQGSGSQDEERIAHLLGPLTPIVLPFARGNRLSATVALFRAICAANPDVTVMEGTGIGGGVAVLAAKALTGKPFVLSSGDAVAPFLRAISRPLGVAGLIYERALCAFSSGFIGWSPYLAGRALTLGAPRAMTAANWASVAPGDGAAIRRQLQIPDNALVFGIVGSLNWNPRVEFCYGSELIRAATIARREDLRVLIVGDGDGRGHLAELSKRLPAGAVVFAGRVPRSELGGYLAAMDVASLPQSVDGVGAFRYTTKLSEYLSAGLPIVTGQIPLAYDLDEGDLWRLPGDAPWEDLYINELAVLMAQLHRSQLPPRDNRRAPSPLFDSDRQRDRTSAFVLDIVRREQRSQRRSFASLFAQ